MGRSGMKLRGRLIAANGFEDEDEALPRAIDGAYLLIESAGAADAVNDVVFEDAIEIDE
jgi:hypothetical protein